MRANVLGMNANPPRGWIPVFGRTTDEDDDHDYQSAIESALINGGHIYLYKVGGGDAKVVLSRSIAFLQSNTVLHIGAGVTLDIQNITSTPITGSNLNNIQLIGEGKIVGSDAHLMQFSNITGFKLDVAVESASALPLSALVTNCTPVERSVFTGDIFGGIAPYRAVLQKAA